MVNDVLVDMEASRLFQGTQEGVRAMFIGGECTNVYVYVLGLTKNNNIILWIIKYKIKGVTPSSCRTFIVVLYYINRSIIQATFASFKLY